MRSAPFADAASDPDENPAAAAQDKSGRTAENKEVFCFACAIENGRITGSIGAYQLGIIQREGSKRSEMVDKLISAAISFFYC